MERLRIAKIIPILLQILLICTLLFSSCTPPLSDDDYITMTVQNRIASFSFEYRAYYRDVAGPRIVDSDAHLFTYVDILAAQKTMPMPNPEPGGEGEMVQMKYVPAFIGVSVSDASKYLTSSTERIENNISSWSRWPNFELLERKMILVDGVQAELIAYQVDGFFVGPALKYQVDVCFDHNALRWYIYLEADIELADMVRADLEHILETFKILD